MKTKSKVTEKNGVSVRLASKVNNMMRESSAIPLVTAASRDPPPVCTGKTLWITRKVRVSKTIAPGAIITVDDVKAQSSPAPFKVKKVECWMPGRFNVEFKLGNGTWINDTSTEMAYVDTAPPGRMPGAKFNIPDQLAEIMNTGTSPIISAVPISTVEGLPGASLIADVTIMYQI